MDDKKDNLEESTNRWSLLRDVTVFQAKLLVDGLRDLVLSPISLLAVAWGLLTERHEPDRHFRRLIRFGARSEQWINLFGQHGPAEQDPGLDDLFSKLEDRLREQHERGGITAHAKTAVDRALDSLQERIEDDAEDVAKSSKTPPRPPADR